MTAESHERPQDSRGGVQYRMDWPAKLTDKHVRTALSEYGGKNSTAYAIRCGELLDRYPARARTIVEAFPDWLAMDDYERQELWNSLTSPESGRPQDSRGARNHQLAVRAALGKIRTQVEANDGSWVSQVSRLMMSSQDQGQYPLVMSALTQEGDRHALTHRLIGQKLVDGMRSEHDLATTLLLLDQFPGTWTEDPKVRQELRWSWLMAGFRAEITDTKLASALLARLRDLTVDINEPDEEGLGLLDSLVRNRTYRGEPGYLQVVEILMDHGARFDQVLAVTLHEDVRATIESHPRARRELLGEVARQEIEGGPTGGQRVAPKL